MLGARNAWIIDDILLSEQDKIKVTLDNNTIRKGTLINIDTKHKKLKMILENTTYTSISFVYYNIKSIEKL